VIGTLCDDRALQSGLVFPGWEALFGYLVEYARGQAFLLVLDEFPYLSASVPALPSVIQAVWDHTLENTRFKLVLSGSYVTAMKRLSEGDQPLHGRRTAGLLLSPFSYREVRRFAPTGRLGDEGAQTFDSFRSDADVHYSIVRAIAEGEHT